MTLVNKINGKNETELEIVQGSETLSEKEHPD